jgi:hypothetical protein
MVTIVAVLCRIFNEEEEANEYGAHAFYNTAEPECSRVFRCV